MCYTHRVQIIAKGKIYKLDLIMNIDHLRPILSFDHEDSLNLVKSCQKSNKWLCLIHIWLFNWPPNLLRSIIKMGCVECKSKGKAEANKSERSYAIKQSKTTDSIHEVSEDVHIPKLDITKNKLYNRRLESQIFTIVYN